MNNEISNLKKAQNVTISSQNTTISNQNKKISYLINEIAFLKEVITFQNESIATQDNIIQILKEEKKSSSEMENQNREWIMTLRVSINGFYTDYNSINNYFNELNYSLQGIINHNKSFGKF